MSIRIAERNLIHAKLAAAGIVAAASLKKGLTRSLAENELPAITVSFDAAASEPITDGGNPTYATTITILILAHAAAPEGGDGDAEAAADAIIEAARAALLFDAAWMAAYTRPPAFRIRQEGAVNGERPIAQAALEVHLERPEEFFPAGLARIAGAEIAVDMLAPDGVAEASLRLGAR